MTPKDSILKMTAEEKRAKSRREIMEASWSLFLEKGYDKTTTRDIVRKAGILNGSLYNRFKSKEDILIAIISDALNDSMAEAEKFLKSDNGPLMVLCIPMAIELYAASKSKKLASLLYSTHQSWNAIEAYMTLYGGWGKKIVPSEYNVQLDDDSIKLRFVTAIGFVGNLCGLYANGFGQDYRSVFEYMVRFIGPIMDIRVYELSKLVDSLCDILESSNIKICGYSLDAIIASEGDPCSVHSK